MGVAEKDLGDSPRGKGRGCQGRGARQVTRRPPESWGPRSRSRRQPHSSSLPRPSPATFAQWRPPAPDPAPHPGGFQQQQLRGPAAQTPASPHRPFSPAAPRRPEKREGSATRETNVLGASPCVLPSRPPRACHLGLPASPPLRLPGSETQAWSPRVPGPRPPPPQAPRASQTVPGSPASVSAVLARAAPEPSPKLAAKLASPARHSPLTGGKGRCARAESPRRPPPARCMSRRLGPRVLARFVLARRAPEPG